MNMPDLDRIWETFIQIPSPSLLGIYVQMIRKQLAPLILDLQQRGFIDWYCFLIHDRNSGVPTTENDLHAYFHLRFALREEVSPSSFLSSLSVCCTMTRKARVEAVQSILGIDSGLLKNRDIRQAWRIIGEQSEWVLKMLDIYREDADPYPTQIVQFLHFFANMTQVRVT